ncbi:type II toxin-antitoxin system mRNA interferase toxin, RelE/StbE family [Candidatus Kuenenbacteria bacterium]|nr:type II toxin-antitoxin system mRNA interferase toxin, RelE/StbE family [Candidatus Kuenenbacteria bacterium]
MIIRNIEYTKKFQKRLRDLPNEMQKVAFEKEDLFRHNPLHPSLRLHELHGKYKGIWTISINFSYRILFERQENGDILFLSIGKHDIYKYL